VSELGKRVAVAAVGIPTVLGLAYLGGWFLALPLGAIGAWASHECYRFANRKDVAPVEGIGIPLTASLVLVAAWHGSFSAAAPWILALLGLATPGTMLAVMFRRGPEGSPLGAASVTVAAAIYVGLALSFAPLLHGLPARLGWSGPDDALAGLLVVMLPLVTTWVGDAAAYFAGSAWGRNRRKLAPGISPNKSWVGFWAGLAGAALAAALWYLVVSACLPGMGAGGLAAVTAAGAVLGLGAVLGDLVESLLKREAGVKDSGTFFPGHGGVMDRIDSLIFTFPLSYVLLVLLDSL
jgi:phosphatidate cytidylyltransferase